MSQQKIFSGKNVALAILLISSIFPLMAGLNLDPRFPGDDALISLCFAKNLASGRGFVFNHPPPVLGSTTPLLVFLVACVSALTSLEPILIAFWFSIFCWLALIWFFFFFRKVFDLPPEAAALIGAMIGVTGWIGHLSMEAYPFALLEVIVVMLVYSKFPFPAGLAAGLLFLLRGEGILFAGIVGAAFLFQELRHRQREGLSPFLLYLGGVALPILGWACYAIPVFGAILPDTLAAKMAQVSSGLWAPFPIRLFSSWLPGWSLGWGPHLLRMGLAWCLVLAGITAISRKFRKLWIFPTWALLYCLGYTILGVPGYPWYRLPLYFVLAFCSGLGLWMVYRWITGASEKKWRHYLALLLVPLVLLPSGISLFQSIRHPLFSERDQAYYDLAQWFRKNADPSQSIAYMEVGYLGYYTDLGIVDLVGLVSPQFIPHVIRRDFSTGFWESRPDYLIELEGSEFMRPILADPRFGRIFRKVADLEGFGDKKLRIYQATASDWRREEP